MKKCEQTEFFRKQIDEIHEELFKLFIRRAEVSKEIWKLKIHQAQNLQDFAREANLLEQFDENTLFIEDRKLAAFYKKFVRALIDGNKAYLTETLLAKEQEALKFEKDL